MKRKAYILLILILLVPHMTNAETCEPEKVVITKAIVEKVSGNVEEKASPIIDGRKIDLNISMAEVGDAIEYKLTIKNESEEDYEIDENNIKTSSDYIQYTLATKELTKIIKAGEIKDIYLRVEYKNQVNPTSFINGVYNDSESLRVNLSSGEDSIIENPKTGFHASIILFIIMVSGTTSIIIKHRNNRKTMIVIIGLTTIIPLTTYALCKCDINVKSNVEIVELKEACIYVGRKGCTMTERIDYAKDYVNYKPGMTLKDLAEKLERYEEDYAPHFAYHEIDECEREWIEKYFTNSEISYTIYRNQMITCRKNYSNYEDINYYDNSELYYNEPLKSSEDGCYDFTINYNDCIT